ncbi:MAG: redox-sensing transcriptional repressor Rex [Anaerovoracaceae bacterium]|nr:redox-sensing transcriptional repressor Rex [Anaerovoracaceae bacterium]
MPTDRDKISNAVIKRLPRYRRYLKELDKKGVEKISSRKLSELIGYTASQIRQDLSNFGGFGQQGYGYNVRDLYNTISSIMGLDQQYKLVVVGIGSLGTAITKFIDHYRSGFVIKSLFESNEEMIGRVVSDIVIRNAEDIVNFVEENDIDIGVICVPPSSAQEVADKLCFAGVRGLWNFANVDLEVPDHVSVENVHLSDSLYSLAYRMNEQGPRR